MGYLYQPLQGSGNIKEEGVEKHQSCLPGMAGLLAFKQAAGLSEQFCACQHSLIEERGVHKDPPIPEDLQTLNYF